MISTNLQSFIKSLAVTIALGTACFGLAEIRGQVPHDGGSKTWGDSKSALSSLQEFHAKDGSTFVVQDELDVLIDENGGGACASAAGIDVLQSLRIMAGLKKLPVPHKAVLESIADQKELLGGRVTNEQFVKLLHFYEKHLEGIKIKVEVESAPDSEDAKDDIGWRDASGPGLVLAPGRMKVVSYTVTEAGRKLGRHFVLLKEHRDNQISVVDPHKPSSDHRYVLEYRRQPDGGGPQVFMLNPAGVIRFRDRIFKINTVFTITLIDQSSAAISPSAAPLSIEDLQRKIDQTAAELRGSDDFLNPRAWRQKTAEYGLPGLDLPLEYGGLAWPAAKMIQAFERAGWHNLNFRDVVGGAHVRPLLKSKNPEVLEVVRQVANGQGYIAITITEPDAGSDVASIKTHAKKVDGGYLLTGTKRFNARLDQATHVIIFSQGTSGERGKLSVFLVPMNDPGLVKEKLEAHGLVGNSFGGLRFKDLFVPDGRLIGEDGEGSKLFLEHFLYWRLMQVAAAIGTGESALKQMADRIESRHAFGGPIGRFTHLQQALGQHRTELAMARSLAGEAARLIDLGEYSAARPLINGLKAEAVEIALKSVDASMRSFGGEGYSTMVDLGDRLRDLTGLRIADGTTDVMRMDVVRKTYGDRFWEMAVEPGRR